MPKPPARKSRPAPTLAAAVATRSKKKERKTAEEGSKPKTVPTKASKHDTSNQKQKEGSKPKTVPTKASNHDTSNQKQKEGSKPKTVPTKASNRDTSNQKQKEPVKAKKVVSKTPKVPKVPVVASPEDVLEDEDGTTDFQCLLSPWHILQVEKSPSDYVLRLGLTSESKLLIKDGQHHIRIKALGREKSEIICLKPLYLLVTLEYGDGSTKSFNIKTTDGLKAKSCDKPFKDASLTRNPSTINKFTNLCKTVFPESQTPQDCLDEERTSEDQPETSASPETEKRGRKRKRMMKKTRTRKRDKLTYFGDCDDLSDFEAEPFLENPKVVKEIKQAVTKLAGLSNELETKRHQEELEKKAQEEKENIRFETTVAQFDGSVTTGFVGHVRSIHDKVDDAYWKEKFNKYPRSVLIDRDLDEAHVKQTMEDTIKHRHLASQRVNCLGIYFGSRDEYKAECAAVLKTVENLRKSNKPITISTKQTVADYNRLCLVGGTHTNEAYRRLVDKCKNVEEALNLYGKLVLRVQISVYCTVTEDADGELIEMAINDLVRLIHNHNRPAKSKKKSFLDYTKTLRAFIFKDIGMPEAPLSTDLPSDWTRAATQRVYNEFLDVEMPMPPCLPSDRNQLEKTKDLAELSGAGFSALLFVDRECSDVMRNVIKIKATTTSKSGDYPVVKLPQMIDRNHVATSLTGLSPDTRESMVSLFRNRMEQQINTIRKRKAGTVLEFHAIVSTLVAKCDKAKLRQLFLFGFAQKCGITESDNPVDSQMQLLKARFPSATLPKNYNHLLSKKEEEKMTRTNKNPSSDDFPKKWKQYFEWELKKEITKIADSGKEGDDPEGTSNGTNSTSVIREAMFGAVVFLKQLDASVACCVRPKNTRFTGIAAAVFYGLSALENGSEILKEIHNNMADNVDHYSLICLNDSPAKLAEHITEYGFQATTIYCDAEREQESSLDSVLNTFEPFCFVTVLSYTRPGVDSTKLAHLKAKEPMSQHQAGLKVLDIELLRKLLDRLVTTNGWVLDCMSHILGDFTFVAKATMRTDKTMHLFIWTPTVLSERQLDSIDFELQEYTDEATNLKPDEELSNKYIMDKQKVKVCASPASTVESTISEGVSAASPSNDQNSSSTASTAQPTISEELSSSNDQNDSLSVSRDSVEILGSAQLDLPPFSPVSPKWQESISDFFGLDVFAANSYDGKGTPIRMAKPSSSGIVDVLPDGNCLFSCFSFVMTGDPSKHDIVRSSICDYLVENIKRKQLYVTLLDGESVKHYVKRMRKPSQNESKKWGSDKDMRFFADMTGTDVWVYMGNCEDPCWERFATDSRKPDIPYEAVYIQNTGSHYQVVSEVQLIPSSPGWNLSGDNKSSFDTSHHSGKNEHQDEVETMITPVATKPRSVEDCIERIKKSLNDELLDESLANNSAESCVFSTTVELPESSILTDESSILTDESTILTDNESSVVTNESAESTILTDESSILNNEQPIGELDENVKSSPVETPENIREFLKQSRKERKEADGLTPVTETGFLLDILLARDNKNLYETPEDDDYLALFDGQTDDSLSSEPALKKRKLDLTTGDAEVVDDGEETKRKLDLSNADYNDDEVVGVLNKTPNQTSPGAGVDGDQTPPLQRTPRKSSGEESANDMMEENEIEAPLSNVTGSNDDEVVDVDGDQTPPLQRTPRKSGSPGEESANDKMEENEIKAALSRKPTAVCSPILQRSDSFADFVNDFNNTPSSNWGGY